MNRLYPRVLVSYVCMYMYMYFCILLLLMINSCIAIIIYIYIYIYIYIHICSSLYPPTYAHTNNTHRHIHHTYSQAFSSPLHRTVAAAAAACLPRGVPLSGMPMMFPWISPRFVPSVTVIRARLVPRIVCACMQVTCIYVCVYIYTYKYLCLNTHTHTHT